MTTPQSDPIQAWMEGLGYKWISNVRNTDVGMWRRGIGRGKRYVSWMSQTEAAFFYAVMERAQIETRIDELQIEATRFRESGHKGLPPRFQKRMNELQRQLATLNKGEEAE